MEEIDYNRLIGRIIYSEEFKKLQWKESPISGFINADQLARAVADFSKKIGLEIDVKYGTETQEMVNEEYCELLAYIKYLGMPAYGKEGKVALDETVGKVYSQSDINIKLAQEKLKMNLPEKMIEDIKQLDYENLEDVTSNEARIVLLAQDMVEDVKLLTDAEKEKLGGVLLTDTLAEECSIDEEGKIIPGRVYNRITPALQKRRRKLNNDKVEKAKKNLETGLVEGIISQTTRQRDDNDEVRGV